MCVHMVSEGEPLSMGHSGETYRKCHKGGCPVRSFDVIDSQFTQCIKRQSHLDKHRAGLGWDD